MPTGRSRDAVAVCAGVLMYLMVGGGLLIYWPILQLAVVVGSIVGVIAATPTSAAMAGIAGPIFGLLVVQMLGPDSLGDLTGWMLLEFVATAVGVGMVAAYVRGLATRFGVRRVCTAVTWAVLCVLVANLWITTWTIASSSSADVPSTFEMLAREPVGPAQYTDDEFYLRVMSLMREGTPYYESYAQAHEENLTWGGKPPGNLFGFREPLLFWFWKGLGSPRAIIAGLLLLVTAAMAGATIMPLGLVRLPLGLIGAAGLASYFLDTSTQPYAIDTTSWAAVILVLVAVALVRASYSSRWRGWVITAVSLAVLAALARELGAYVFVIALGSSMLVRDGSRRFRLTAWGLGAITWLLAYGAHFLAARGFIVAERSPVDTSYWFANGGVDNLVAGIRHSTTYLGNQGAIPWLLLVIGIIGAVAVRRPAARVYLLGMGVLPLFAFLVTGTGSLEGRLLGNYWGVLAVPLLYICVPIALAVLPGVAVSQEAAS